MMLPGPSATGTDATGAGAGAGAGATRAAGDAAQDLAKAKAAAVRAALEAAADSPTAMKAEDAELGGGGTWRRETGVRRHRARGRIEYSRFIFYDDDVERFDE